MKRIVLTGAESTGKSTLAAALSGYYGEPWTTEFVRQYVDGIEHALSVEDLVPIAKGQLTQEDHATAEANRLIIHDTNILSSIIYANYYFETVIDWVNETFLARDYNLYLLCMPDIPWVPDEGQREGPEVRDTLHRLFKETLDKLKLPYVEISGNEAERFGTAIRAIDATL
ncbi:MAG: ATP-binding protein [Opitutales bacterium]|jgi:NadR type nicotinamide-nucleotide adenylyltransferase|nr:ATP-binding protein [Opitutales bacterium]MDP4642941.1 ATP-binding protein [Opitutales bacterium]MDP4694471.1 ATP-binding protein [Opitutales bacterium]MDP4776630.1 ATP-binding protein [Opitutales bacterium]MDP4882791.1 ATP-binding protein [Opitutales bacterium]